jgi:DNA-binding NarL/FixJ family response regulator
MNAKKSSSKANPSRQLAAAGLKKTRVVLVDDHPILREGLIRVIDRESDLTVCGEAQSIQQALEVIESSAPDIAIVDISLGGQSGIELIKDIKVRYPRLLVLVHSMHDELIHAERALRAGAKGYIGKKEPPQKLLQAIREVLQGEIFLSPSMTRQILHGLGADQRDRTTSQFRDLSDREFEVFELTGQGLGTKEIASALHLSEKTVQAHRDHIRQKLDLPDGRGLTRLATRWIEAQS